MPFSAVQTLSVNKKGPEPLPEGGAEVGRDLCSHWRPSLNTTLPSFSLSQGRHIAIGGWFPLPLPLSWLGWASSPLVLPPQPNGCFRNEMKNQSLGFDFCPSHPIPSRPLRCGTHDGPKETPSWALALSIPKMAAKRALPRIDNYVTSCR